MQDSPPVTAEEVRVLKQQVDERQRQLDVEKAAAEALEEERQRLETLPTACVVCSMPRPPVG